MRNKKPHYLSMLFIYNRLLTIDDTPQMAFAFVFAFVLLINFIEAALRGALSRCRSNDTPCRLHSTAEVECRRAAKAPLTAQTTKNVVCNRRAVSFVNGSPGDGRERER